MSKEIILDCITCEWTGTPEEAIHNKGEYENGATLMCENLCQLYDENDLEILNSWNANSLAEKSCGTGRFLWWQEPELWEKYHEY